LKNECYDPETDSWVELADTPKDFGEIGQAMAIMDGVAYFLGISKVPSTSALPSHTFYIVFS